MCLLDWHCPMPEQCCSINLRPKIFESAEKQTQGSWVKSANATSVLCRPPMIKNLKMHIYQRNYKYYAAWWHSPVFYSHRVTLWASSSFITVENKPKKSPKLEAHFLVSAQFRKLINLLRCDKTSPAPFCSGGNSGSPFIFRNMATGGKLRRPVNRLSLPRCGIPMMISLTPSARFGKLREQTGHGGLAESVPLLVEGVVLGSNLATLNDCWIFN